MLRSSFLWHLSEPLAFFIYCIAFYFYTWKVNGKLHYWIISIYYLIASLILTRACIKLDGETSNTYYYNLLYPITSVGLSSYFFFLFQVRWKKVITILTGLTSLIYYLFNVGEIYFDSMGHVISSIGIVLLILLYLHQLMSNVSDESLSYNFDFWYVCIQLMNQLGSFAIFLSYNYFTHQFLKAGDDKRELSIMLGYLWVIHNIILFIGALITGYAVVHIYRKRVASEP